MKKNKIVVLLAVVALVLASLACNAASGGGGGTVNISNAHMATDKDDTSKTTVYTTDAPSFFCYFDLNNATDTTVVKGTWTLVSAEGYEANSEIDSAEITGGDNTYYFSLDRSGDSWPVGKYKIDLYIDGNMVQTVEFEVQ
jgi:hypothetical protein